MADKLCSDRKNCSSDMYVGSLFNYNSILDLTYVDVAFMHEHVDILALIDVEPQKANKTNHLHAFLQYEQYPPLIPQSLSQHPPPNQRDHIHPMECIMFSASWLQSRV